MDTFRICLDRIIGRAMLFRLCFCQERLDQMILEVPSNLEFYDYMNCGYQKYQMSVCRSSDDSGEQYLLIRVIQEKTSAFSSPSGKDFAIEL